MKRIFGLIMCLILVFSVMSVSVSAACITEYETSVGSSIFRDGDFEFATNGDGTLTVKSYYGDGGVVEIPSSVNSMTVADIGRQAFFCNYGITKVVIPNTVRSIGYQSFYGCGDLESVEIPASVTKIYDEAFSNCSNLKSVTMADSVTSIGSWTFAFCTSLTEVKLSENIEVIEKNTFYDCEALKEIVIPKSVKSIKQDAFAYDYYLSKMTILNPECEIYDDVMTLGERFCVIYGYEGSTAQAYAQNYGREFVVIGESRLKGDVDGNGEVQIMDATTIQLHIAELITLDEASLKVADVDGSGDIDIMDVTRIQLFIAELIPQL